MLLVSGRIFLFLKRGSLIKWFYITSSLCSYQPASQGHLTEEASYAIIDRYVQWGGNFIDTADVYGKGASETVVGSWLAK